MDIVALMIENDIERCSRATTMHASSIGLATSLPLKPQLGPPLFHLFFCTTLSLFLVVSIYDNNINFIYNGWDINDHSKSIFDCKLTIYL